MGEKGLTVKSLLNRSALQPCPTATCRDSRFTTSDGVRMRHLFPAAPLNGSGRPGIERLSDLTPAPPVIPRPGGRVPVLPRRMTSRISSADFIRTHGVEAAVLAVFQAAIATRSASEPAVRLCAVGLAHCGIGVTGRSPPTVRAQGNGDSPDCEAAAPGTSFRPGAAVRCLVVSPPGRPRQAVLRVWRYRGSRRRCLRVRTVPSPSPARQRLSPVRPGSPAPTPARCSPADSWAGRTRRTPACRRRVHGTCGRRRPSAA